MEVLWLGSFVAGAVLFVLVVVGGGCLAPVVLMPSVPNKFVGALVVGTSLPSVLVEPSLLLLGCAVAAPGVHVCR